MPRIRTHAHSLRSVLVGALALALVGALVAYGIYQSRLLIAGPSLALAAAGGPTSERVVSLTGTAKNVTEITLNGRPIFTDSEGNFREQLVLEAGYTIITLRAEDRYGRTTALTREFVYTPAYES